MKRRKWNVKLFAAFFLMILLGFFSLYFMGFSYPGKVTVSQAYSFKEGEDGRRYLLDQGHERLLCMDQQNKLLYTIECPKDVQKRTLYIDDFCTDEAGNLYLQASCWDGMHLSEEIILRYDSHGRNKEVVRQWDYSSEWVYKHKVYGLSFENGKLQYAILNKNQIEVKRDKETEIDYESAETRLNDCVFSGNSLFLLDKNGKIYKIENVERQAEVTEIFDVNQCDYSDGIPYRLGVSEDEKLFYTDIRNRRVMLVQADNTALPVVENTDTLTVSTGKEDTNMIFLTNAESGEIWKTDGTGPETLTVIHTEILPVVVWIISAGLICAGVVGCVYFLSMLVRKYAYVLSGTRRLGLMIGVMLILVAATVSGMLLREFRNSYKEKVEEQIEIVAYMEAEQLKNKDISSIRTAADYDGETYQDVSRIMEESLPTDIEFYQNIYCNILVMDEQKEAYAVAYLDQSIGSYFPLDEVETREVQQVYETGKAVWNKGKDDIAGSYTYIKVPIKNESGEITGVVAVGTELIVLNQILTDIIKGIVAVLAVLILLFGIFFEEVLAFLEDKRKYQEREKKENGIFPCHWIRLIIFGVFAAYNMTASFLPVYLMRYVQNAHFHNTELAASLPVTINIFVIGVTSLICQKLTVKLGIRKLAVLSGLCSFAGNLMLFIAPSYVLIVTGLILDGIGVGFMTNAVYILISRIVNPQSRMEGLAIYNSAYLAGINFGIMLGSLLAVQFGQRNVFIFVSTTWILLVAVIISVGAMLERDTAKEGKKNEYSGKISAGKFLSDKAVSSFFVLIQNPYIIFGSFVFYFVPLFCDNEGFSELTATLLLLLYAEIPVILGNRITQWAIEKIKYSSMYLAVGLNVLALLVFVCYPKLPGMILALIVMGISACFGKTAQQMYFLDLKSVKEYGEDKSIGIYNFTENIGESLGPVVLGQIMFISPLAKGVLPLCMIVTGMGGIYYLINRKK